MFNDRPESHAQLLTSLADEVYVQREQWRAWGLHLFVRRGDDVRPRLEDDDSMRLVRELLWRGDHPSDRPILLRTDRKSGHGQGSSLATRIEEQSDQLVFLFDQLGMHWSATQADPAKAPSE